MPLVAGKQGPFAEALLTLLSHGAKPSFFKDFGCAFIRMHMMIPWLAKGPLSLQSMRDNPSHCNVTPCSSYSMARPSCLRAWECWLKLDACWRSAQMSTACRDTCAQLLAPDIHKEGFAFHANLHVRCNDTDVALQHSNSALSFLCFHFFVCYGARSEDEEESVAVFAIIFNI